MLCEDCGKNEATVHIQAIGPDGSSTQKTLCQECMNKLKARMPGVNTLDISEFLGALIGRMHAAKLEKESDKFDATCPACGRTYGAVKESGILGCPECYKVFREPIEESFVKRNGSAIYVGKTPDGSNEINMSMYKVNKLRLSMREAVENEDFETAAKLRDEIRMLEKVNGEAGDGN